MIRRFLPAIFGLLWRALSSAGLWLAGRRSGTQTAKIKGLEGYKKTRERIDDAPHATDADDARKRLSERDPKQR